MGITVSMLRFAMLIRDNLNAEINANVRVVSGLTKDPLLAALNNESVGSWIRVDAPGEKLLKSNEYLAFSKALETFNQKYNYKIDIYTGEIPKATLNNGTLYEGQNLLGIHGESDINKMTAEQFTELQTLFSQNLNTVLADKGKMVVAKENENKPIAKGVTPFHDITVKGLRSETIPVSESPKVTDDKVVPSKPKK